ncbi:unnamed protein product [Bemisia tabaci]|uniref:Uncharacterized protein n=1 Tax=Bemisia tabaci TaxID=7038 RepID=A0A9P0A3U4_BEMTA|nr:unnamed protein product [Bemisia tabaci]
MLASTAFLLPTLVCLFAFGVGNGASSGCQCPGASPKDYLQKPAFFAICTGILFTYGDSKFRVEDIRDAINQRIGPAFAADDKTGGGNYERTVAAAREVATDAQVSPDGVELITRSIRNITVLSQGCGFCPEVGCSNLYAAAACYNNAVGLNKY